MVKLEPFEVDHWILTRDIGPKYNLAHSYSLPVTINDLKSLSENTAADYDILASVQSTPMNYGPSFTGLEQLRENIANLYSDDSLVPVSSDKILTTPGASLANFIVLFALIGPGDHVIVQYPTYQQLYSLPASLGAQVSLWKAKENDNWKLDIEELERLIQPNTKMIVLNNPQNPTGAIIPKSSLEEIIRIAKNHSITVFSDEVYRPSFHSISPGDPDYPPSALSFGYENTVVTSSLSKAYALAGIRIGWIASHSKPILDLCINARSYALITASQVDEQIASFALSPSCVHNLVKRNTVLAKNNRDIVQSFIDEFSSSCQWVKPVAGPIGFIRFARSGHPVDDVAFCTRLLEKKGVLLVPGRKCFGDGKNFSGYVRLGFGGDPEVLKAALGALREFMLEDYESLPLAD
ncbi:pyridoxal phosphate-dependent transferase [Aspergillus pseudonomiae]|uniref:Pyridoxal phosphate-dependent transferase n=1 Tax=Aspergillus pseudonomiae TaxID=1506151 RepID=A0A5N6I7L4_9EURO|nr:pyridoxal phosphate-dependent transferase [Aspergillus pseudonomiae]KAB8262388.1 pyridoxal phosphate-dependent transferase [Aspergillus pseudonomiae]KAE8407002.1 pyridoxal phosphate-dependent transferase [Aspergillus pseudonomiae]